MQTQLTLQGLQPYLSFLGSFVQFGSSALLITLFLLLRPYAQRRRYFVTWSYAWIALTVALGALMVRYNLLPVFAERAPIDTQLRVRVLYFWYQVGKIAFYGLLVVGSLRYVRSAPRFPSLAGFGGFALLYTMFSLAFSPDLNRIIAWQTPIAVSALAYAAWLMLSLPVSRRSLGSKLIGTCLTFGASIWALYLVAFNLGTDPRTNPLIGVVQYNTYLDLAWHLTLAFGMVVLLMEDLKHEVDAAHAELAVAHDNLRRASFYDSVTGSLNRQAFAEGLGLDAARAAFGSVAMLDMDNLKNINDEFGHAAGDSMLRYLVEVIRSELRASDKLYRFGGDEFLIVFPGAEATHVGRRIRTLLSECEPLSVGRASIAMRVSVGSAAYTSAENIAAAIDAADRAMYAEKMDRKRTPEADVAQSA